MLRLLDTLALLAAPFAAAWDQEFGGRCETTPAPPATPTSEPVENTPPAATEPPVCAIPTAPVQEVPALVWTTITPPDAVIQVRTAPIPDSHRPKAETEGEPLYVRRGAGRGARYDVAGPEVTGDRWRRVVGRGGKAKYVPHTEGGMRR